MNKKSYPSNKINVLPHYNKFRERRSFAKNTFFIDLKITCYLFSICILYFYIYIYISIYILLKLLFLDPGENSLLEFQVISLWCFLYNRFKRMIFKLMISQNRQMYVYMCVGIDLCV